MQSITFARLPIRVINQVYMWLQREMIEKQTLEKLVGAYAVMITGCSPSVGNSSANGSPPSERARPAGI
jgi:hypothetical protein